MTGSEPGCTATLTIRMFGPFEVYWNGASLPRLRSRKGYWLLALLALRHGREVERRWLAGTLWPDSTERQALDNLRNSLKDLRRALGVEAHRLRAPAPHSLCLDLSAAECDLIGFDAAITQGDTASLESAVAHYRAPLLEDWSEEWIYQERRSREQAYLTALETLGSHAVARRAHATAIRYLQLVVAAEPLRESAQCALMQALAVSGDYSAATQTYRDLRVLLHRELNTEPNAKTKALYQQIRGEARDLTNVAGAEPNRAPEREQAGKRDNECAHVPPSRIPHPLTRLIGRQEDLQQIEAVLASSRLMTLTGAGGVGKTRLAIQVAQTVRGEYADGVWFVELAALADPALVPRAVAQVLGVSEQPGSPLDETLKEVLHRQQLLLVFDNCEHLLAACAELADTLLRHCPHLRILATSRQPFGLTGEVHHRVPSLTFPEPASRVRDFQCSGVPADDGDRDWSDGPSPARPADLMRYEAIQLFIERAQAVHPSFTLTDRNSPAIAQLCRHLDGIPLAIELAAARVNALPVETLNERLADVFRLLVGGSQNTLPRHQTLQATIDWSYALLSDPERTLLQRLAIFAGGWTLEAAEAVCGDAGAGMLGFGLGDDATASQSWTSLSEIQNPIPRIPNADVLNLLSALVEKSLVHYDDTHPEAHYRLLETVRQFAAERLLASDDRERIRERHCAFFLRWAEEEHPKLFGSDQIHCLLRLETDHDNLRAALRWGLKPEPGAASGVLSAEERGIVGLRLTAALWQFWAWRDHMSEGEEWLSLALLHPPCQPSPMLAQVLLGAGWIAFCSGQMQKAGNYWKECLELAQWVGERRTLANALSCMAWVRGTFEGDRPAGRAYAEQGLALAREMDDPWCVANALYILAYAVLRDDPAQAWEHFTASLALARKIGDPQGTAIALAGQGNVAFAQGDLAVAMVVYEETLTLQRRVGDRRSIAAWLCRLGEIEIEQGHETAARTYFEEALPLARQVGTWNWAQRAVWGLTLLARRRGDVATHRALFAEGVTLARRYGSEAANLKLLARVVETELQEHDYESARELCRELLLLSRDGAKPGAAVDALAQLGRIEIARQRAGRAARILGAAEALGETIGTVLWPRELLDRNRLLNDARTALCDAVSATAWAEGRTLSLEDAIAYALAEDPRDPP